MVSIVRTVGLIAALGGALACGDDGSASPEESTDSSGGEPPSSTSLAATADDTGSSGTSNGDSEADSGSSGEPEGNPLLADRTLNIAHRGGAALRPEETLVAFDHALQLGADVLELDVHGSADGVIVCMHDDTVDRTTDGTGAVSELTFDELRALDAGYDFSTDGGRTFPFRGQGVLIASLQELFEAHPDAYFAIEIKQSDPPIAAAVVTMVEDAGMVEQVVLASFSDETLAQVRTLNPDIMTSLGLVEYGEFLEMGTEPGYSPPAQFVQAPFAGVTEAVLATAKMHELRIHAWTVNEAASMQTLIDRGVDGIMTDDPELLQSLLDSR